MHPTSVCTRIVETVPMWLLQTEVERLFFAIIVGTPPNSSHQESWVGRLSFSMVFTAGFEQSKVRPRYA